MRTKLSLRSILFIAVSMLLLGGVLLIAPGAKASSNPNISNQEQLLQKVRDTNAGWNWEPRCAHDAHWSWNENRCEGGTKHHGDHHGDHHDHHDNHDHHDHHH